MPESKSLRFDEIAVDLPESARPNWYEYDNDPTDDEMRPVGNVTYGDPPRKRII